MFLSVYFGINLVDYAYWCGFITVKLHQVS